MKYKIICDNEEIEFTNKYPALTFFEDTNKNFYRVNNNIVEVNYSNVKDINEDTDLSSKYKIIFIILKDINNEKIEKLNKLLKYSNVIAAVVNEEKFHHKEIMSLKGINKKINVEALIDMFSNKEILMTIKNRIDSSAMIIGDEPLLNPLGNILINILKNFNYIDNYNEYIMYIYAEDEFDLSETASLEDLMREYLYSAGKIEIKQFKNSEIKDNVFYSILATR